MHPSLRYGLLDFSRGLSSSRSNSSSSASPASIVGRAREIVHYPDPRLRLKCAPIPVDTLGSAAVQQIIADLVATAKSTDSMGCAAPQIGELLRAFVVRRPVIRNDSDAAARRAQHLLGSKRRRRSGRSGRSDSPPDVDSEAPPSSPSYIVCVNPVVLSHGEETEIGLESCLSMPDHVGIVRRYAQIDVEYVDATATAANGAESTSIIRERLAGLPAVVFQHELDHLDGILSGIDREMRVFPIRSREEEYDRAFERWQLGLMQYYGVEP